jgi:hypothetical protein
MRVDLTLLLAIKQWMDFLFTQTRYDAKDVAPFRGTEFIARIDSTRRIYPKVETYAVSRAHTMDCRLQWSVREQWDNCWQQTWSV